MCNAVLYPAAAAGASPRVVAADVAPLVVRVLKRDIVHKAASRNSHPKSVEEQLKHIGSVRIASSDASRAEWSSVHQARCRWR